MASEFDDFVDGCAIDFSQGSLTSDDEVALMPLFARALDPEDPKTVDEAAAEWHEIFGAHGAPSP